MAIDCGWQVFGLIRLQGLLRQLQHFARGQEAVVHQSADKSKILLLVGLA